jgi:hypothetical protein
MKIISGGQTGADQAGLYAARDSGFQTGGTAPKGYRTQGGHAPELAEFGVVEHPKRGYQHRTEQNVIDSDCTFRLAHDFTSAGEKLTLRLTKKHNKPCYDINMNDPISPYLIAQILKTFKFKIVNIAGNGDGEQNGEHFDKCYKYLMMVFKELKK